MSKFEKYLEELSLSVDNVDWTTFLINVLVVALLTWSLGLFYTRYGNAISNRKRFAKNFLPLGLTTMLIIYIVKSSLALSLGLVGALSIVRFRAAIKDPEELTYLFLTIGLGLAAGANQIAIALIAFIVIITTLFIQVYLSDKTIFGGSQNMTIHLETKYPELKDITAILVNNFESVDLKRVDYTERGMNVTFLVNASKIENLDTTKKAIRALDEGSSLSMIEQRDIAL